jgi:hypothetical protein
MLPSRSSNNPPQKNAEIQALKQSMAELKETLTHLTQQSK